MKNLNKVLLVAAFAAVYDLAGQASAQVRCVGDDVVAASPKLRQMLNERKRVSGVHSITVAAVGYKPVREDGIAASPKFRQLLDERKTVPTAPTAVVASSGYRAENDDGIAASPKLRQQLNERAPQRIMVAPVK